MLADVGADTEWWLYNPTARVGHLRVALTDTELAHVPPGDAVADAGPAGPPRRRHRPPDTKRHR